MPGNPLSTSGNDTPGIRFFMDGYFSLIVNLLVLIVPLFLNNNRDKIANNTSHTLRLKISKPWKIFHSISTTGSIMVSYAVGNFMMEGDDSYLLGLKLRPFLFTASILPLILQVFLFWLIEFPKAPIARGVILNILNAISNTLATMSAKPKLPTIKHFSKEIFIPSLYGTSQMQTITTIAALFDKKVQHQIQPPDKLLVYPFKITLKWALYFFISLAFRSISTKGVNPFSPLNLKYLGALFLQSALGFLVTNIQIIRNPNANYELSIWINIILQSVFLQVETAGNYNFAKIGGPILGTLLIIGYIFKILDDRCKGKCHRPWHRLVDSNKSQNKSSLGNSTQRDAGKEPLLTGHSSDSPKDNAIPSAPEILGNGHNNPTTV